MQVAEHLWEIWSVSNISKQVSRPRNRLGMTILANDGYSMFPQSSPRGGEYNLRFFSAENKP